MNFADYQKLAEQAIAGQAFDLEQCTQWLTDPAVELFPLLNAAYAVRQHYWGKKVQVHILNNAQNGNCPEDCAYCTQARTSEADIEAYPIKSDDEILAEAERAYNAGAHRYCMVFAGRGPNKSRTETLARLVRKIKDNYPIEVCVSAGLLDDEKAEVLAEAGLDRLNHNLNTSRDHYASICTTHTYDDRLKTLQAAQKAGLGTCSGLIVGMGESPEEVVEVAHTLRDVEAASIPVNFLLPFEGNTLDTPPVELTPEYCLRVLCMFRFTNPQAEVRCAAGREFHLRAMEAMCLYPANSIFMEGYLNAIGSTQRRTYQMILDAGFEIESDHPLDEIMQAAQDSEDFESVEMTVDGRTPCMKSRKELRPTLTTS